MGKPMRKSLAQAQRHTRTETQVRQWDAEGKLIFEATTVVTQAVIDDPVPQAGLYL